MDPNLLEELAGEAQRRNIEELFPHFLRFREMLLNHGRRLLTSDFDLIGRPIFDRIRPIDTRLTEEEISRLPSVIHTKDDLDKTPTCPICLSEFIVNDKLTALNCHHRFHSECINNWLKDRNSCPTCRTSVTVTQPSTSNGDQPQNVPQLRIFQLIRQRRLQTAETNEVQVSSSNPRIETPIVHPVIEPNPPSDPMEIIDITSSSDEDEDADSVNDALLPESDSISISDTSVNMDDSDSDSDCVILSSPEREISHSPDEDIIIID